MVELYKKIRPDEPSVVENAESLINAMFFDAEKIRSCKGWTLTSSTRSLLSMLRYSRTWCLAEDAIDPSTGEVIAEAGTTVSEELADTIQDAAVPYVMIQTEERNVKVLSNMMVNIANYVVLTC